MCGEGIAAAAIAAAAGSSVGLRSSGCDGRDGRASVVEAGALGVVAMGVGGRTTNGMVASNSSAARRAHTHVQCSDWSGGGEVERRPKARVCLGVLCPNIEQHTARARLDACFPTPFPTL